MRKSYLGLFLVVVISILMVVGALIFAVVLLIKSNTPISLSSGKLIQITFDENNILLPEGTIIFVRHEDEICFPGEGSGDVNGFADQGVALTMNNVRMLAKRDSVIWVYKIPEYEKIRKLDYIKLYYDKYGEVPYQYLVK